MKNNYSSPRWSNEWPDCSMPLTFDQYSTCGFKCLYCFSFFQRAHKPNAKIDYLNQEGVASVNVDHVKRVFTEPNYSLFWDYISNRKVMQWGGLSDPFCPLEKRHRVGLELLKFFREIDYPISFSTKGTWFLNDPEYVEVLKGGNFHFKISIITLDERKARGVEIGVPSPAERLEAIYKIRHNLNCDVTLRFRPFIIGISDPYIEELIQKAANAGADSVSTEFFCLEGRASDKLKKRYSILSKYSNIDFWDFYRKNSTTSGYFRLRRAIKKPYMERIKAACDNAGVRLHVSDAHFKELGCTGSCCGLSEKWN